MQKRKINIGIVCSPVIGGSGVVGSELAKYLAKTGKYNVIYIGFNFPFRLNRNDVYFHRVDNVDHALFTHPLREVALTEGIVEASLKHKLDIIHAHFAIPFADCALQAKEILKKMGINIKVVTTLHGTDVLTLGLKLKAAMKYILDQSDAVTAVSNNLASHAIKLYHPKKNIQVIYNFIDLNQPFNKVKKPPYINQNEKVFVHISNFRPIKRVADTIKVFSKIHKIIPSHLLLIGKGPQMAALRKLSESLKGDKHIHFLGVTKNPYSYLKIADGLIVTSEYESFCLVGLEAMAFGVPVFSTKVGGIAEVIQHGKSGYLVKRGDLNTLAKYIIKHFSDPNNNMKHQAKDRAKNFAADKIIPQYEQIYQKLLS